MKRIFILAGLMLAALTLGTAMSTSNPDVLKVNIINSAGKNIGTAEFTQKANKVYILVEAESLPPGIHGIHFHNIGQCDGPDFTSAGPHFNPQSKLHGFHNPQGYHAGDLPNILVGAEGKVKTMIVSETVTLEQGKPNSILKPEGTSLVIHEKADDYVTDPSGNSGNRIACGIIK